MSGQFAARIPNCSDRYRLVGVLPLRDTPTRITSAVPRSLDEAPSSWARAKLIASMRWVYPFASRVLCGVVVFFVDVGRRGREGESRAACFLPGAEPFLIRLTQVWAFSTESMK